MREVICDFGSSAGLGPARQNQADNEPEPDREVRLGGAESGAKWRETEQWRGGGASRTPGNRRAPASHRAENIKWVSRNRAWPATQTAPLRRRPPWTLPPAAPAGEAPGGRRRRRRFSWGSAAAEQEPTQWEMFGTWGSKWREQEKKEETQMKN